MNNIERDLRRRLKKSIKKRTELNDRWIEYKNIVDKAISKLETYANNSRDNRDAYAMCVDLLDELKKGRNVMELAESNYLKKGSVENGFMDKNSR